MIECSGELPNNNQQKWQSAVSRIACRPPPLRGVCVFFPLNRSTVQSNIFLKKLKSMFH